MEPGRPFYEVVILHPATVRGCRDIPPCPGIRLSNQGKAIHPSVSGGGALSS